MSLSRQVITSGFWLQISRIIQLGSNFIVSVILARLLLPAEFGLAGMVTLYGAFVAQFTMLGLTLAIIQKKDISQRQLSSLFWINLAFNLFTAIVVGATAPLAARYYQQPQLVPLILCYCVSFLISPFFQVHRRLLEKKIYFNKIAGIEVAASIGSGIVGVVMALVGFGVYSIVWQIVSLNFIYMITTRLSIKWKPDFVFSLKEVKELIFFSVKMKGVRMASFLERNIDFIILSKMFTATLFGFYSLAYRIMYFPVRRISYVFSEILFPAFSNIQENIERVKIAYLKSFQVVAISVMPLSVILGVFSNHLIVIFIGKKWLPISNLLFILSMAGLMQSLEAIGDSLYPALDKAHTLLWLQIARTVLTGIAVFLGGLNGLFSVAVFILVSRTILFIASQFLIKHIIKINFLELLEKLIGPLAACLIMFAVYFPFRNTIFESKLIFVLILILGGLAYGIAILIFNFKDIKYIYSKIKIKAG